MTQHTELGLAGAHECGCDATAAGHPELDARTIPHAVRHGAVFGALDAVAPGAGLILVAPHDPLPLLDQLQARNPDAFDISYVEQGPAVWRLAFVKKA